MIETRKKTCCKCHTEKPIEEFYTSGRNKNGTPKYMSKCKECNCQNRRHKRTPPSKQKQRRDALKLQLTEYKKTLSCIRCGIPFKTHPEMCDFHHIDPSLKVAGVGYLAGIATSWDNLFKEISKCVPVCANCHRIIHAEASTGQYRDNTKHPPS
jgi:hypothetical protein